MYKKYLFYTPYLKDINSVRANLYHKGPKQANETWKQGSRRQLIYTMPESYK
jgi:hypothetical protein